MNILGIISEYNPFHNGHAEQLRIVREHFGSESLVIACMSGDFVQRGEAALMNKWHRAEAALACGVNLVLELGALFACSSADYFAAGAVNTLAATGLPLTLCFGSEAGQLDALTALAKLRRTAGDDYKLSLKEALKSGQSYAAAHEVATRSFLASDEAHALLSADEFKCLRELEQDAAFWRGSNNQLALAYIAAVEKLPEAKQPGLFTHPRSGAAYLESSLHTQFSSATAIRQTLEHTLPSCAASLQALRTQLPAHSLAVLLAACQNHELLTRADLTCLLASRIRAASSAELAQYHGWDEGLPERLKAIVSTRPEQKRLSFGELIERAKSKRFPATRVQRACMALLLGIKKGEVTAQLEAGAPFYIRVLGADRGGRYLLRRMRKTARLPLFTKTSDFLEITAQQALARRMAELDLGAADLHSLLSGAYPGADFDKPMLLS